MGWVAVHFWRNGQIESGSSRFGGGFWWYSIALGARRPESTVTLPTRAVLAAQRLQLYKRCRNLSKTNASRQNGCISACTGVSSNNFAAPTSLTSVSKRCTARQPKYTPYMVRTTVTKSGTNGVGGKSKLEKWVTGFGFWSLLASFFGSVHRSRTQWGPNDRSFAHQGTTSQPDTHFGLYNLKHVQIHDFRSNINYISPIIHFWAKIRQRSYALGIGMILNEKNDEEWHH